MCCTKQEHIFRELWVIFTQVSCELHIQPHFPRSSPHKATISKAHFQCHPCLRGTHTHAHSCTRLKRTQLMTSQRESYRPGGPAMTCGVLLLRTAGGVGWVAASCSLGSGTALVIAAAKAGDEGDLLLAGSPRAGPGLGTRLWLRAVVERMPEQWEEGKETEAFRSSLTNLDHWTMLQDIYI